MRLFTHIFIASFLSAYLHKGQRDEHLKEAPIVGLLSSTTATEVLLCANDCWEKHDVCLWARGSGSSSGSSSVRTFPPFPSSIDPPWLCRSQMKTSCYDLWDVIYRGTSGAPPPSIPAFVEGAACWRVKPAPLGPTACLHTTIGTRKQTGFIFNSGIPLAISLLLWGYWWRPARTIPDVIHKTLLNIYRGLNTHLTNGKGSVTEVLGNMYLHT